jgi:hypothetical protein
VNRTTRQRAQLMLDLAARIPVPSPTRPVRVAVDGVDGSGKTTFAAELARSLRSHGRPVVQVSADSFHHPRAVRHRRGRDSAEGFWLDSYDYAAFISAVLLPFAPGGSRRYRTGSHDLDTDHALDLPWRRAPVDAVLVVDGLFLHRDELVRTGTSRCSSTFRSRCRLRGWPCATEPIPTPITRASSATWAVSGSIRCRLAARAGQRCCRQQ